MIACAVCVNRVHHRAQCTSGPLLSRPACLFSRALAQDHGATSSATSSLPEGGPTSSSGANDKAAQAGDSPMHRGGAGGHHKAASAAAGSSGARIPKLPMVQFGKKWYRSKLVREKGARVLIECQGLGSESGPIWLAKDGNRIWKGSMKGKDWRYLVGGGENWETGWGMPGCRAGLASGCSQQCMLYKCILWRFQAFE